MSSQLDAPELLCAPLNAVPPDAAIRKLALEESEKGHWNRVFDLLNKYARCFQYNSMGMPELAQAIPGIADYMAGQNFENAEQWPQAVQSYQNVLRRVGTLLPTAQATARLKELKKQHPEAFNILPAPIR